MPFGDGRVDAHDASLLAECAAMDEIYYPAFPGRWKPDVNRDEPGFACGSSENCWHGVLMEGACSLGPDAGAEGPYTFVNDAIKTGICCFYWSCSWMSLRFAVSHAKI